MELLRLTPAVLLALYQGFGPSSVAATHEDSSTPCRVTEAASVEARIATNSTFGELWEYHGQSSGTVTLRINYLLSPMGELTGSFTLDPGEISHVICEADAAQFFSLPRHIETKHDAVMVDGPELTISIRRAGVTTTVQAYDPSHLRNQNEVARFLRVWNRIFKPLPLKPVLPRGPVLDGAAPQLHP
jgi:hypothetical protein